MRALDTSLVLFRIYFSDDDRVRGQPLERALLERLRRDGFAGATALRGIAGFGARRVVHTAGLVDLSGNLPIVVEVVDDEGRTGQLLGLLDELFAGESRAGALVTVERVRAVRYARSPG
jgi:PII-like signaling protein